MFGQVALENLIILELHILYPSPRIIRMVKSRRMKWAENVSRMRKQRNLYRLSVGKPEGK
jgi:hypothetical protein